MLLSAVLFALFLAGCWLYSLTDVAVTPAEAFDGWSKRTWIVIIATTLIFGAAAWAIARRRRQSRHWPPDGDVDLTIIDRGRTNVIWYSHPPMATAADAAVARHPASRSMRRDHPGWTAPKGPDDDPEFLRQLDQRIHGTPTDPAAE